MLYHADESGKRLEPMELAYVDVPDEFTGAVIEKLSQRKGELRKIQISAALLCQRLSNCLGFLSPRHAGKRDYNEYVGRIGVGKVDNGCLKVNQDAVVVNHHEPDKLQKVRISKLYEFDGITGRSRASAFISTNFV